MNKNYFELEVGGQKRGLKFNNRTLDNIGKITNEDPLSFKPVSSGWADLRQYARVILYASLLSNMSSKKEEPSFTEAEVTEWMDELQPQDLYMIMGTYKDFLNPPIEADGEVSKDTRGEATVVAGT